MHALARLLGGWGIPTRPHLPPCGQRAPPWPPCNLHTPFKLTPALRPSHPLGNCSATFDPETIRSRLRELAFLHSAATIHFRVRGAKGVPEEWEVLHYSGGWARAEQEH